ncbi:MAG: tyrosine-type recombinase/integrase [bacterium]|nr:tyrosine-type recombinase/integrase [bacterium]
MASLFKRSYKSGKAVWAIKYRIDGIQKLHTIGAVDKRTAEKEYHKFCHKLMEGGIEEKEVKDIYFDDFKEKYLEHSELVKGPETMDRESRIIRVFRRFIGNIKVKSINRMLIDGYIRHRLKCRSKVTGRNISNSTVNLELRIMKVVLNTAQAWGYIASNPIKGIKMLKEVRSEHPRFLSIEEIQSFREAFKGKPMENLVNFYLWTGARRNEALTLTWDDVDFKKKTITIRAHNSKSNRARFMYPPEDCWDMLKSLKRRKDNLVFGPISPDGEDLQQWRSDWIGKTVSLACNKLGLEWATLHTLRHTFASHLVMAGVPLYTVKELLGHSSIKTTEIYAHLAQRHKSEMQSRLPY